MCEQGLFLCERAKNRKAPLLFETSQERDTRLEKRDRKLPASPYIPFPETPQKRDTHPKNDIGMNFDDKFLPKFMSRAAKRGGFKRGGFPIWTCPSFFCPFLSFLGLSRFFWDFPDLLRDGPGIFPIRPFSLSLPIKSTYEEQSRKGPRHNLDLFPKKVGNPPVWKPPRLASLNKFLPKFIQNSPDRGQSRKIRSSKFPGCGLKKI